MPHALGRKFFLCNTGVRLHLICHQFLSYQKKLLLEEDMLFPGFFRMPNKYFQDYKMVLVSHWYYSYKHRQKHSPYFALLGSGLVPKFWMHFDFLLGQVQASCRPHLWLYNFPGTENKSYMSKEAQHAVNTWTGTGLNCRTPRSRMCCSAHQKVRYRQRYYGKSIYGSSYSYLFETSFLLD